MPRTRVAFFQGGDGKAPVVNWLRELMETNEKAWAHCRARIELLAQFGHELRRPAADYLRDGIYELRAKQGHVHSVFLSRAAGCHTRTQPDEKRDHSPRGS